MSGYLLGPQHTGELTRAQYRSIRRLAALPDEVEVPPTHGAGSFCVAAMPATRRTTTIGQERQGNLLSARPTRTPSPRSCAPS